jgi:hypothetical protein
MGKTEGYFIPPIIFSVKTRYVENKDGTMTRQCYRTCVDGKQRLTSVQRFMTGEIGVYDSSTPTRKWLVTVLKLEGGFTKHNAWEGIINYQLASTLQ